MPGPVLSTLPILTHLILKWLYGVGASSCLRGMFFTFYVSEIWGCLSIDGILVAMICGVIILWVRKLNSKEIQSFDQVHSAIKWQSQLLNVSNLALKSVPVTSRFCCLYLYSQSVYQVVHWLQNCHELFSVLMWQLHQPMCALDEVHQESASVFDYLLHQ